jgi:hypothetical protein
MVTMNKNHPPFNPKVQGSNFFLNFTFFSWMDEKENVVLGQLPWAIISSYLASSQIWLNHTKLWIIATLATSHKIDIKKHFPVSVFVCVLKWRLNP